MPRDIIFDDGELIRLNTSDPELGSYFSYSRDESSDIICFINGMDEVSAGDLLYLWNHIDDFEIRIKIVIFQEIQRRYELPGDIGDHYRDRIDMEHIVLIADRISSELGRNDSINLITELPKIPKKAKELAPSFSRICKRKEVLIEHYDCEVCFGCNLGSDKDINTCKKKNTIKTSKLKMDYSLWYKIDDLAKSGRERNAHDYLMDFLNKNKKKDTKWKTQ